MSSSCPSCVGTRPGAQQASPLPVPAPATAGMRTRVLAAVLQHEQALVDFHVGLPLVLKHADDAAHAGGQPAGGADGCEKQAAAGRWRGWRRQLGFGDAQGGRQTSKGLLAAACTSTRLASFTPMRRCASRKPQAHLREAAAAAGRLAAWTAACSRPPPARYRLLPPALNLQRAADASCCCMLGARAGTGARRRGASPPAGIVLHRRAVAMVDTTDTGKAVGRAGAPMQEQELSAEGRAEWRRGSGARGLMSPEALSTWQCALVPQASEVPGQQRQQRLLASPRLPGVYVR